MPRWSGFVAHCIRQRDRARLLRLPAGPPSRASGPEVRASDAAEFRLARLQGELLALMDELVPLSEELANLRSRYGEGDDPRLAYPERSRLRQRIVERHGRYSRALADFFAAKNRVESTRIKDFLLRSDARAGSAAASVQVQDFYHAADSFNFGIAKALSEDVVVLDHMRKTGPSRAARSAAGVLLLALAGGVFAWRRRNGDGGSETAPEPARPFAGAAVLGGNFRVERELGRGGMGVVYEAADLALGRRVAVKRMRAEVSQDPRELDRFVAEARLVAALTHPNIVSIHTFFREGDELCLVFELVPGDPLSARLAGGARMDLPPAARILRQVAAALDYAHSRKVIHRDLKPANIMVTPEGTAKVMDFGLAHRARLTVAQATRADAWGTLPYMAPEAELGEVSRESDIYSLGVCAYEMLTGKMPFEGPNYLAQKREKRFARPSCVAPGLPPAVDDALARAMAPEPADRFQSAAELVDALELS